MDQKTIENQFNMFVPLTKAKSKDGKAWVHGVASDEDLDLQHEVTIASGLKDSIPYLTKFGKFNDNHSNVDVGEVMKACVTTYGELIKDGIIKADSVPASKLKDDAFYVAGPLYSKVPRAQYYKSVLESDGRLGLSLQGSVKSREIRKSPAGNPVTVNTKCFINKIAITDEPVHPNTWCALQKSFSGQRAKRRFMRAIVKALTTGSGIVTEGTEGGATFREQSLIGANKRKKRKRPREARKQMFENHVTNIEKSLGGLSFDDVSSKVCSLLNPRSEVAIAETSGYVNKLYDDYAIVCKGDKFFRYPYSVKNGEVTLGEPTEVERIEKYEPVAKAAAKSLALGELETPVQIVKAWNDLANPSFIGDTELEEVRIAKSLVREAAKSHSLSWAIREEEKSGGSIQLCKSLGESGYSTMNQLENMSDESFNAFVEAEITTLAKSRSVDPKAEAEKLKVKEDAEKDKGKEEEEKDVPLDKMSLSQLKAYAKKNDIDLSDLEKDELKDAGAVRDYIEDQESGDEEDEDEDDVEKSLADLNLDPNEDIDVTPVLSAMAKAISGLQSSLDSQPERTADVISAGVEAGISKALTPLTDLMTQIGDLNKSLGSLQTDVDNLGRQPARVGGYSIIEKSLGGDGEEISKSESLGIISKAIEHDMAPVGLMAQFETSGVEPSIIKSLKAELKAKGI